KVMFEVKAAANPRIVGLVPYAPVPLAHDLTTPLFDAAPDNIAAAVGEPAHRTRVVHRPLKFGEGYHGCGADVEHGLDVGAEQMPVCYGIGRVFIKQKNTDDPGVHLTKSRPDLLTLGPQRERPPTVGLVHAIAELHPHLRWIRAPCSTLSFRHRALKRSPSSLTVQASGVIGIVFQQIAGFPAEINEHRLRTVRTST